MRSARRGDLCVVFCDPGPVSAACFRCGGEDVELLQSWTGGPRPSWLGSSSMNMRTMLVDSSMALLMEAFEPADLSGKDRARGRIARIGMDSRLDTLEVGDSSMRYSALVAARVSDIVESRSAALAEGIVLDGIVPLSALILGGLFSRGETGDSARLFHLPDAAVLVAISDGKLSSRRFPMPIGAPELEATLHRLPPDTRLLMEGFGGVPMDIPVPSRDDRSERLESALLPVMTAAARLCHASRLVPAFRPAASRRENLAIRWSGPLAACAILSALAVAPFVWSAVSGAFHSSESLDGLRELHGELARRARENSELGAELKSLSDASGRVAAGRERTEKTIYSLLALDECRDDMESVSFARIRVDGGSSIQVAGSLPSSDSSCLDRLIDRMESYGYEASSDLNLTRKGPVMEFSFGMEANR